MFALNLFDRLVLLPTLLRFQFNPVLLLGMLAGAVLLLWRERKLALLLIGSSLIHTAVTLTYDAPQTVEYEMPAYVSLALLMAVPFGRISGLRPIIPNPNSANSKWQIAASFVRQLSLAIFLTAGVVNLATHGPSYGTLSRSHDARDYAEAVLREAPEDAVVLSNWHWFNPLRYLQQIEGVRPDVTVEYVAPRAEPLAQTWVRRIDEHILQRPVVVVRKFEQAYSDLPYRLEPLGEAFLVRRGARSEAPPDSISLDITLGEQIKLLGYQLASDESEAAQPLTMTLHWSPITPPTTDIALFAQLIGTDGRLWSAAEDPLHSPERLRVGEVVADRFVIYPLLHASPDDYDLVIGAYSPRGRFVTPEGADTVRLERVHLQPSTTRPVTGHPCFARFAGGPTLIGVDYDIGVHGQVRVYLHWMGPGQPTYLQLMGSDDAMLTRSHVAALKRGQYATIAVDLPGVPSQLTALGKEGPRRWNLLFARSLRVPAPQPGERYVPFGDAMVLTGFDGPAGRLEGGSEVNLYLRFRGQRPLERDYIVSTALTGLNPDGTWAWRESHDTVPALGAIPTLKWIRASAVLDPHRMTIPDGAPAVPVVGSLLAYDHFTQRSLPHLDERLEPSIQLGIWNVTAP
jgi:multisubunit Na+/H+ antiporter MnhC subunit